MRTSKKGSIIGPLIPGFSVIPQCELLGLERSMF
jgi:hypothetical protein